MFAENDSILHAHLHSPRLRNATYLSPQSQNSIIELIGNDIIRGNIIKEVKKARFYSVIADEVSRHLPLCIRFLDEDCNIREEFVAFVRLQRVHAKNMLSLEP